MGTFLTARAAVKQTAEDGIWQTLHNQLYMDDDGQLYLVPRYYETDGYTIPLWIAWLGGGKMEWDIRPSTAHDFECQYHQELIVTISKTLLKQKGFLRKHITENKEEVWICEDIPIEFLKVRNTTFKKVNAKFYRMMLAASDIKNWRAKMMFYAVHLNIGWLNSGKKPFDLGKIYKNE